MQVPLAIPLAGFPSSGPGVLVIMHTYKEILVVMIVLLRVKFYAYDISREVTEQSTYPNSMKGFLVKKRIITNLSKSGF